jgi:hypothetical protein
VSRQIHAALNGWDAATLQRLAKAIEVNLFGY